MVLGLKGKRAVVLAASQGLGYACALNLAHEEAKLVICSRNKARIEAAAEMIRDESGARVHPVVADVSREESIKAVVQACVDSFGGLEIVIHNAGGPPPGDFEAVSIDQWYQAFDQNLMSFTWLVRAAISEMKKAGYGRIIAITSSSIKQPIPSLVLSNVMRTGVLGLARTLAKELAPHNILVNVIAPGGIETERTRALNKARAERTGQSVEEIHQANIASIPLGRLGRPEELAHLATFLASEAASYITGTAIQVDGGQLDALQ